MGSGTEKKQKPDIHQYHDYREFLTDWFTFHKASRIRLTVRAVARAAGVSESYLSMVLSGARPLSEDALNRIGPHLGLDSSEQSFLSWLLAIQNAESEEERLTALKKIQRFHMYREHNANEIEVYEYLTHWHYVAIREMSALPDFELDPKWIRTRLKVKIPLKDVRTALDFLIQHGFIELDEHGKCKRPGKNVHAKTGVLRPALTKFHRELLAQACSSIASTPSRERNISAHTAAIPVENVPEVKKILDEARDKIMALSDRDVTPESEVYHFGFLAFPLTKAKQEGKT